MKRGWGEINNKLELLRKYVQLFFSPCANLRRVQLHTISEVWQFIAVVGIDYQRITGSQVVVARTLSQKTSGVNLSLIWSCGFSDKWKSSCKTHWMIKWYTGEIWIVWSFLKLEHLVSSGLLFCWGQSHLWVAPSYLTLQFGHSKLSLKQKKKKRLNKFSVVSHIFPLQLEMFPSTSY